MSDEVDEMIRAGVVSEKSAALLRRFMADTGKNEIEAMDHLGLWHAGGNIPETYMRNRMRREERAAIVAYLRSLNSGAARIWGEPSGEWKLDIPVTELAMRIERGEHLK